MGELLITIIAGILFGIFFGVFTPIAIVYFREKKFNKNILKNNPNLVKDMQLNKEVKNKIENERTKHNRGIRERERNSNGFKRIDGRTKPNDSRITGTSESSPDKDSSTKRSGVQISDTGFTIRD